MALEPQSETEVTVQSSPADRREPPDPAVVRTFLVEVLEEHPDGLTKRQIAEVLTERLGVPLPDPVEVDLEGLKTLGVVAESERDDRLYTATKLASMYLSGAKTLQHG